MNHLRYSGGQQQPHEYQQLQRQVAARHYLLMQQQRRNGAPSPVLHALHEHGVLGAENHLHSLSPCLVYHDTSLHWNITTSATLTRAISPPTSMSSIPVSIRLGASVFQTRNPQDSSTTSQELPTLSKRLEHGFFPHPFFAVSAAEGGSISKLRDDLPLASSKDLSISLILANCTSMYDQALLYHRDWTLQHHARQAPPQDRLLVVAQNLYTRALHLLEQHILPEAFLLRSLQDYVATQEKKKAIWLFLLAICTNASHCAYELRHVAHHTVFYQRLQQYMVIAARQIPWTTIPCPHLSFFQVHSLLYSQGWGCAAAA